jgi:hypothetical protein
LELEDSIHEGVEANNDLRNISECEDAKEHRYGPVLCYREKDHQPKGASPLLLLQDPWARLKNKTNSQKFWEIQYHLYLVIQLRAAGPLGFPKRRCDGKLDSVPALASQT